MFDRFRKNVGYLNIGTGWVSHVFCQFKGCVCTWPTSVLLQALQYGIFCQVLDLWNLLIEHLVVVAFSTLNSYLTWQYMLSIPWIHSLLNSLCFQYLEFIPYLTVYAFSTLNSYLTWQYMLSVPWIHTLLDSICFHYLKFIPYLTVYALSILNSYLTWQYMF